MSDNTEYSSLLDEMRSTSLEKQSGSIPSAEHSHFTESEKMKRENGAPLRDEFTESRVRIPWVITIVITEKELYGYFGVEDTTNLMSGWRQAILDITGKIMDGGPYVYDREECLQKVFLLKAAFEEMNKTLINPVPICCITVTRAEFDPQPTFLKEITQFAPSRTTVLYFSPDATKHLNILEYSDPVYTAIAVPIKGKVSALLDKRTFSYKEISNGTRFLLRDVLVCVFQASSESQLEKHIKERKLLCKRGDIFICAPEKVQEEYLVFSFSYAVNFTTIYEQWSKSDCTVYVSRLSEVVLARTENKYHSICYIPCKQKILELLELIKTSLVIDPLAVPYCEGAERRDYDGQDLVYSSSFPSLRVYKKSNYKTSLPFCGLDCALERIAKLEKVVQQEER